MDKNIADTESEESVSLAVTRRQRRRRLLYSVAGENVVPRIAEKRRRMDALRANAGTIREGDRSRIMDLYEQAIKQNPEDAPKHAAHAFARLMEAAEQSGREHPSLTLAKVVASQLLDLDRSPDLSWSSKACEFAADLALIEPDLADGPQLKAAKEAVRVKLSCGHLIEDCRSELELIRAARKDANVGAHYTFDIDAWYMLAVRPSFEQAATDALRRWGIKTWWPNYRSSVPNAKCIKNGRMTRQSKFLPVITGIVFCQTRWGEKFRSAINSAPGVIRVERKAGAPIVLSPKDITLLENIERDHGKSLKASPGAGVIHSFKCGEKVRFKGSGGAGLGTGDVVKLYKDGRLIVRGDLMGRKVDVTVLPRQIERL